MFWVTFGLLCACLAGLIVGFYQTFRAYSVPSAGMAPTIHAGDRVYVQRGSGGIRRGDIVIIQVPGIGLLARRVIGVAGDDVRCCDPSGRVTVNGKPLTEDYLPPGSSPSGAGPGGGTYSARVGVGQVWLLGDNRSVARDSRIFGAQPASAIAGRVIQVDGPGFGHRLKTPQAYVDSGLAPPDNRVPLPFVLIGLSLLALLAIIVQAIVGITRWAVRRRRRRRQQAPAWQAPTW